MIGTAVVWFLVVVWCFLKDIVVSAIEDDMYDEKSDIGMLKKNQKCPYCHDELELTKFEQRRRQFDCPNCNKVIDLSDSSDVYKLDKLPVVMQCPKCMESVELDEDEQLKKQFTCPYCQGFIDFTVKAA